MIRWTIIVWLLAAIGAFAQTSQDLSKSGLAELNQRALAAFNAGDRAQAMALTETAVKGGAAAKYQQPEAYLLALNNLTFLTLTSDDPTPGALAVGEDAVAFAEETDQIATPLGLQVLENAARIQTSLRNMTAARQHRDRLIEVTQGTDMQAYVSARAVDLAFANGDVTELPQLVEAMIARAGGYTAQTNIEQLYAAQERAETSGDADAVAALVDTRILLVSQILPDGLDAFRQSALWAKFFARHRAEEFGRAAKVLREIAEIAPIAEPQLSDLRDIAGSALQLSQLQGFGDRAGVQLGYAELTVALAEVVYSADDPRIGLAQRELAFAHSLLGRYDASVDVLQDAVLVLSQTEEGTKQLHLVLEDLAANKWQTGELEQAHRLYEQAGIAQKEALTRGAAALSAMDKSILALNRARLQTDRQAYTQARSLIDTAEASFARHLSGETAKPRDAWHHVSLAQAEAVLTAETGTPQEAKDAALHLVETANAHYPNSHPARALALSNAADQLAVLGEQDHASALFRDALTIARTSQPENAPMRSAFALKLALAALSDGDRQAALPYLREAAEAHRAPENHAGLAAASETFEILAWALLSSPEPSLADVDEALAALQWTQTTQSADSFAMMAARLSANSTRAGRLIKDRQDAMQAIARNRSALTAAFAEGAEVSGILTRQAELQRALSEADQALQSIGAGLVGQAAIDPLTVSEIQSRLAQDEVLVTFLLPSLEPDAIPGLDLSSNLAVAIRKDGLQISKIPEKSRGALNRKLDAFRCEMAISDLGCESTTHASLRGSMDLNAPEKQGPIFAWQPAYDLYVDLFGGVDALFQDGDKLIIIPPGDLLRLPFQALITRPQPEEIDLANADWLIKAHAISVLPSIAAFDTLTSQLPASPKKLAYLGVGDPAIGSAPDIACDAVSLASLRSGGDLQTSLYAEAAQNGLRLARVAALRRMQRLPDASCELRAIKEVVGADRSELRLREAATETEIKALSASGALASYDLLVFATHGLVAGETSAVAPGLVLTPPEAATVADDGLLTAAEIAALDLAARLVILSACNTAAGDAEEDEGLSGLASGFFHAGARSIVVTHWAVYSDAAARISSQIAGRLARYPAGAPADFVRATVLEILDDPQSSPREVHPSYWAAFALVGL